MLKKAIYLLAVICLVAAAFRMAFQEEYAPSWVTSPVGQMASSGSLVMDLTQNVVTPITNGTNDYFSDAKYMGLPIVGDSMTVRFSGSYTVVAAVGFEGTVVNSEYDFGIVKNGTFVEPQAHIKMEIGDDQESMSFVAVFGFDAGDSIKPAIRATSGNHDITVVYAQVVIRHVGAKDKTVFLGE